MALHHARSPAASAAVAARFPTPASPSADDRRVAGHLLRRLGLGVVVSAFLSFERSVGFSSAWPLTFEDALEGSVWVGVYSGESHVQERAHDTLARRHPLELCNCE